MSKHNKHQQPHPGCSMDDFQDMIERMRRHGVIFCLAVGYPGTSKVKVFHNVGNFGAKAGAIMAARVSEELKVKPKDGPKDSTGNAS